MNLADLRRNYTMAGLEESHLASDPLRQFEIWFAQADAAGLAEPNAMTLATVSPTGELSARTVLLKLADARGLTFFSNYLSDKAADLAAHPRAALLFPWISLERQVQVRGRVSKVSRAESEEYYHSRPRGSRLGAWASRQSAVVPDRATLERQMAEWEVTFPGEQIPLPENWGGFRLIPDSWEFWQGRPNRLHDRLRYRLSDRGWVIERLSP